MIFSLIILLSILNYLLLLLLLLSLNKYLILKFCTVGKIVRHYPTKLICNTFPLIAQGEASRCQEDVHPFFLRSWKSSYSFQSKPLKLMCIGNINNACAGCFQREQLPRLPMQKCHFTSSDQELVNPDISSRI